MGAWSLNGLANPNPDFFDFFLQPAIEVAVPFQVRRPVPAAAHGRLVAAGFLPLLAAGRASPGSVEGMPAVAAGALPPIGGGGFPIAFWAGNFYFSHFLRLTDDRLDGKSGLFVSHSLNRKTGLR
jgi:hypothetical protein